jgi:hypothetical protein
MILHDQLPNSLNQNGKTAWSHTKEIVQKHNKNCLQQKTLSEPISVEIKTMYLWNFKDFWRYFYSRKKELKNLQNTESFERWMIYEACARSRHVSMFLCSERNMVLGAFYPIRARVIS